MYKVELMGSFNSWREGIEMTHDTQGLFFCRLTLSQGPFDFKFRVNDNLWLLSTAYNTTQDPSGNLNNRIEVRSSMFKHDNLVDLRRFFSSMKLKLGSQFKKMYIDMIGEDVCVVKRLCKSYKSSYVLVARLSFNPDAPPIDFEYELPGWVQKVKSLYYFEKDFEVIDPELPRLKCNIREKNDLSQFGFVRHKSSH